MKTFEEVRAELAPVPTQLLDSLLAKGFHYAGSGMKNGERSGMKNGERCVEVKSEGNEIVIHPFGNVELFTEFLDPADKSDVGHHIWTVVPTASTADVAAVVEQITSITGDN